MANDKCLEALGVVVSTDLMEVRTTTIAMFDDTCGNLIQMHQG